MAITIAADTMTSDVTPHVATCWPMPEGQRTLWTVSWLPGRQLTRSEAVEALTLAEEVAIGMRAGVDDEREVRIGEIADLLGVPAAEAVRLVQVALAGPER